MTASSPDPLVGRTIGGYRVEEVIGRGGMGAVYKATQLSLGRTVAIKVLPEDLVRDPQFLERFAREADVLARLSHPNIVTVFDRGEVDGRPFLAMEYVEGPSLREVLRGGRLAHVEALRIISSVLSALEHAHGRGVVHRDIKPENVLLARGGIVKVTDFGLSRLLGPEERTRLTRTHLVLGTYEYMAPEQREHAREADTRSDLYATGVVLYEMLTGELPIGRFEMPSRRRPADCDRRIDALIERALEKDPEHRYQRADEMGAAVSRILDRPKAEAEPAAGSDAGYQPTRLDWHIDNLATIDYVLGTLAYVAGLILLFDTRIREGIFGTYVFSYFWLGIFVLGWYLRDTAASLRRYRPGGRTAQALIAILSAFTGVLVPFTVYSFWALFSHRGRIFYEARGRGLEPSAAARYAQRVIEAPLTPPTPPSPPAPPPIPHPDAIPVQSVVTSRLRHCRRRPRLGALLKILIFLALVWAVVALFASA